MGAGWEGGRGGRSGVQSSSDSSQGEQQKQCRCLACGAGLRPGAPLVQRCMPLVPPTTQPALLRHMPLTTPTTTEPQQPTLYRATCFCVPSSSPISFFSFLSLREEEKNGCAC